MRRSTCESRANTDAAISVNVMRTNRNPALWCWPILAAFVGCDAASTSLPAPANSIAAPAAASPGTEGVSGRPLSVAPTHFEFADVTSAAGIDFAYKAGEPRRHYSILDSLGGGLAMMDFDGDGWLDLYYPGGGEYGPGQEIRGLHNGLFRNHGGWQFQNVTDIAAAGGGEYYSHGCACADFNDDGFVDVLVTGFGGLQLLVNQGDGTFQESRRAVGLTDSSWSSSAGWGDFNSDGNLDLYVAHYVNWSFDNHPFCPGSQQGQRDICGPRKFEGLPDIIYYSDGQGGFRDESEFAGLRNDGKGLGVLVADFDQDGDQDVYVANDEVENFLYLNDGGGKFTEEAGLRGAAVSDRGSPDGSMGVDLGDFNADGFQDIFVANYEEESFALYQNDGAANFMHVSRRTGVTALGGLFVGFGSVLRDFDQDGDLDLAVTNGHVILEPQLAPFRQVPVLLMNRGGSAGFVRAEFPASSYFQREVRGRGLGAGDLDNDGDLDLAFSHMEDPVTVLRNDTAPEGSSVQIRLVGRISNRDGVGASLTLRTSMGDQTRQIVGGGSYCTQSDLRLHFGIPKQARALELSVRWPSGIVQQVSAADLLPIMTLLEPNETTTR
jgi:enediyne biosynthesis protein E4